MTQRDRSRNILSACFSLLVIVGPVGRISSETFVLQGEKGDPGEPGLQCDGDTCTIGGERHLVVDGDLSVGGKLYAVGGTFSESLTVSGEASFDSLNVESLTVNTSVWYPECPEGYMRDLNERAYVLCLKELGDGRHDEMVKVGDFWIDKYEMSIWSTAACGGLRLGTSVEDEFEADTLFYACSVDDVFPSSNITWFEAQQTCAASGKSLCTNAEWQAAAANTSDPGASVEAFRCLTASQAPRKTGQAGSDITDEASCISIWGAEDMVGNYWEWTADWFSAGMSSDVSDLITTPWPMGYGDNDVTFHINGSADDGSGNFVTGLPAATLRGGDWQSGTGGGVFAVSLSYAPTYAAVNVSARCCRHR